MYCNIYPINKCIVIYPIPVRPAPPQFINNNSSNTIPPNINIDSPPNTNNASFPPHQIMNNINPNINNASFPPHQIINNINSPPNTNNASFPPHQVMNNINRNPPTSNLNINSIMNPNNPNGIYANPVSTTTYNNNNSSSNINNNNSRRSTPTAISIGLPPTANQPTVKLWTPPCGGPPMALAFVGHGPPMYSCIKIQCPRPNNIRGGMLKRHWVKFHAKKENLPFKCPTCQSAFPYQHQLRDHNCNKLAAKRFECPKCLRRFNKTHRCKR